MNKFGCHQAKGSYIKIFIVTILLLFLVQDSSGKDELVSEQGKYQNNPIHRNIKWDTQVPGNIEKMKVSEYKQDKICEPVEVDGGIFCVRENVKGR